MDFQESGVQLTKLDLLCIDASATSLVYYNLYMLVLYVINFMLLLYIIIYLFIRCTVIIDGFKSQWNKEVDI